MKSPRSVFEPACRALSFAVPLFVTALRVGAAPEWRDDMAVVQGLGFVPIGGEGTISSLLASLFALLPIGGRVLRAGLVGAVGAALAGRAIYALARVLLAKNASSPGLAPFFALAAALAAALSPSFQHAGTAAGGTMLAVGLGLSALALGDPEFLRDVRVAALAGAAFALTVAESRLSASLVLVGVVARSLLSPLRVERRSIVAAVVSAAVVSAFSLIPLFVRPFAEHAWVTLGTDLASRAVFTASVDQARSFAAWNAEMGALALALGVGGIAWGLVHQPLRARTSAFALFGLAGAILPVHGKAALSEDPYAAAALFASAAFAVGAALGVQTAARALTRAQVPLAAPAAALLVVFQFTLVFAAAEGSSNVVTDQAGLGADVWTDEALGELPPNALLLVRSPALAWRLWAARVTRGERPDIVIVPLALVDRGTVAAEVLREEPAAAPLIRDIAMTGHPSEYALAGLADARPLFVELDPAWDKRLLDHLRPTSLWIGFTPHTLGRSDRTSALTDEDNRRAFRRVLGVARSVTGGDRATLTVLGAHAREQAVVLASLGDKDNVKRALTDLGRIEPRTPFANRLAAELATHAPVDARALLE